MPSPADRARFELVCRIMALGTLLWLTVEAVVGRSASIRTDLAAPLTEGMLADWSTSPPADTIGIHFEAAPDALTRDWLVALQRTGTGIRWSDGGVSSLLLEAERQPDPAGEVLIRVSGRAAAPVQLTDAVGPLDTLSLGALGASRRLASPAGEVRAMLHGTTGEQVASVRPAPGDSGRHVVVIGAAGWESKFIAAALAERGWIVDAKFAVAPGLAVTQGKPFPLDTARHVAVLLLDSTALTVAPAVLRFLRDGGGLVLAPGAAELRAFQGVVSGGRGELVRAAASGGDLVRREHLQLQEIASLVATASVLERRGNRVAVAVRRIGAGRVVQVGYEETWRWRMSGGPDGLADHRAWWSGIVATVAYRRGADAAAIGNAAPRAALFAALGDPSEPSPHRSRNVLPLMLLLLTLSLFGEWTSRRLRGAR